MGALSLVAQWASPDTIGADELFWRGVLDPRDRALDQALVGQPRLVFRRGRVTRLSGFVGLTARG
ncbi:MAG: hypothetical protein ACRDPC_25245 [Solirubrobacteraceae bacterium]